MLATWSVRGILLAGVLTVISQHALGEDFRIENLVFTGKETKPVSETTTLFRAGIVYDYLDDGRVAVFDKPRGRFLLIDPDRHIKSEVSTEDVEKFCDRLQLEAAGKSSAYMRFMARPEFEADQDDSKGELTLASPHMTYRITITKPEKAEAVEQYREFSDWYGRLNAMTNPGTTPPFPRLAVNEELARRGVMAEKIQLTIPQSRLKGRTMTLRSEHRITWRLLPTDLNRITETEDWIAKFKSVRFAEYRSEPTIKR